MQHATAGCLQQIPLPYNFIFEKTYKKEPPPLLGAHTEEVLESIGISKGQIYALIEEGIIKNK